MHQGSRRSPSSRRIGQDAIANLVDTQATAPASVAGEQLVPSERSADNERVGRNPDAACYPPREATSKKGEARSVAAPRASKDNPSQGGNIAHERKKFNEVFNERMK